MCVCLEVCGLASTFRWGGPQGRRRRRGRPPHHQPGKARPPRARLCRQATVEAPLPVGPHPGRAVEAAPRGAKRLVGCKGGACTHLRHRKEEDLRSVFRGPRASSWGQRALSKQAAAKPPRHTVWTGCRSARGCVDRSIGPCKTPSQPPPVISLNHTKRNEGRRPCGRFRRRANSKRPFARQIMRERPNFGGLARPRRRTSSPDARVPWRVGRQHSAASTRAAPLRAGTRLLRLACFFLFQSKQPLFFLFVLRLGIARPQPPAGRDARSISISGGRSRGGRARA